MPEEVRENIVSRPMETRNLKNCKFASLWSPQNYTAILITSRVLFNSNTLIE
jgi:hypothetical protein